MLPTKLTGLLVQQKKRKIDFKIAGHLRFTIEMNFTGFDLQVTVMLPTKFQVNWPFDSGEEAENRFSRRRPWRPLDYRSEWF